MTSKMEPPIGNVPIHQITQSKTHSIRYYVSVIAVFCHNIHKNTTVICLKIQKLFKNHAITSPIKPKLSSLLVFHKIKHKCCK